MTEDMLLTSPLEYTNEPYAMVAVHHIEFSGTPFEGIPMGDCEDTEITPITYLSSRCILINFIT
jgi:hypothetical protein